MKRIKPVLIALLAVLPAVYTSIAVFFILPETVAAHFNIHGQVDRYGSKYEALILPAVILVIALFFLIIRKIAKIASTADNKTARNLDVLDTAILLIFAYFNVLCVFILTVMGEPSVMQNDNSLLFIILSAAVGLLFILMGNILPKTRRNSLIGMRMKFCMDTDEHWYIANRAGGIAMVLAGFVTVIAGLLIRQIGFIFVMMIALLVFLTVAILYSYGKIKKK